MIIIADHILAGIKKLPLENRGILVQRGTIAEIGPASRMLRSHLRERVLDLGRSVLLPGLVNVHTHLELPNLGISLRNRSYASWVLNLLKAKSRLHVRDYRKAVMDNIVNMRRAGTTTVADISTHGISRSLLGVSGLRAIVYDEIIAMLPRTDVP